MARETVRQKPVEPDRSEDGAGYLALFSQMDHVASCAADGIVVLDENCRIAHANRAAERMLGAENQELVGKLCDDSFWAMRYTGRAPMREELSCYKALTTGEPAEPVERTLRRPDGTEITVLINASPIFDDGRIVGVVNSYTDISKIREAEAEQRESDEQNRSLLRIYRELGRANSYSGILAALLPEIQRMLGYERIWLQVLREDELLTLHAGDEGAESASRRAGADGRARVLVGDDELIAEPFTDDPFLQWVVQGRHVDVLEDARIDPITNKPSNRETIQRRGHRTVVTVPLILAEEKVGVLCLGTFFDEGVLVPTESQLGWLDALAGHVAVVVDRVNFICERLSAQGELERTIQEVEAALQGVVRALASASSQRDPYTGLHQERVARLACAIAERMGFSEERVETVRIAAVLHDIGKVAVPAEILSKPTMLNDLEMGLIRAHPRIGHELLESVPFRAPIATIVLQHHERLDGSGYPAGLRGEEIMLETRILSVADVVEAKASHRPYRPALGVEAALAEIQSGAGTSFDADVVAACVQVVAEGNILFE